MLSLIIYLLSKVGSIQVMIVTLASIALLVAVIAIIYRVTDGVDYHRGDYEEYKNDTVKIGKYGILCLIIMFIGIMIPSAKTISAMYLLPKMIDGAKNISQNEKVKQLPDKVLTILNGKLDEYISDLTENKTEE